MFNHLYKFQIINRLPYAVYLEERTLLHSENIKEFSLLVQNDFLKWDQLPF